VKIGEYGPNIMGLIELCTVCPALEEVDISGSSTIANFAPLIDIPSIRSVTKLTVGNTPQTREDLEQLLTVLFPEVEEITFKCGDSEQDFGNRCLIPFLDDAREVYPSVKRIRIQGEFDNDALKLITYRFPNAEHQQ
jgi:hypothetical protein